MYRPRTCTHVPAAYLLTAASTHPWQRSAARLALNGSGSSVCDGMLHSCLSGDGGGGSDAPRHTFSMAHGCSLGSGDSSSVCDGMLHGCLSDDVGGSDAARRMPSMALGYSIVGSDSSMHDDMQHGSASTTVAALTHRATCPSRRSAACSAAVSLSAACTMACTKA